MIIVRGIIGEDTGLIDVMRQAEAQQGDTVRVQIDSPGGIAEVGLQIYDYLKGLNRKVITIAKNQCGSIASVIFMAGEERIAGCDIFIHNPFFGDVYAPMLTQEDLATAYSDLEDLKKKINGIYSKVSGMDKNALQALMDGETAISPEDAVALRLATAVSEETGRSHDYYIPVTKTNNIQINKLLNIVKKEKMIKVKITAAKIRNFLKGAKNLDFTDKDGNVVSVDIPSDREEQKPEVGDMASPDGTYELEDGRKITVTDGIVTEVSETQTETETERIEALEAENAQLRATLEEAATQLSEYEAMQEKVSKKLNIKRDFNGKETPKSALQKAIEERKEALKNKK